MDLILEQCPGTLGISDDTAVYGKTVEEHDQNLHQLRKVAARYGLIFNIEKCEIRKERIKFFGNYYAAQGVHPDPEIVQEIHNLPPPANTVELQRFLGMIHHFTVESDHKPLENIQHKNLASTPPRLQRMMLQLQQYDFEIRYKPGKEMILSDMLFRQNPAPSPTISIDKTIHQVRFSSEKLQMIRKETENDETFSSLKNIIVSGWPEDPKQVEEIDFHVPFVIFTDHR
ncbi:uncharacterized protein LOC125378825 [Haliotis rufescens]|uniref:uncharacterized protein LOC125378825 n=1 Tax=Haliotis rufescens TaxID=6454 RepID=UPI00201E792F|nr:uncharacterized protein LOC125378825 [Haliotis rufescens]